MGLHTQLAVEVDSKVADWLHRLQNVWADDNSTVLLDWDRLRSDAVVIIIIIIIIIIILSSQGLRKLLLLFFFKINIIIIIIIGRKSQNFIMTHLYLAPSQQVIKTH